MGRPRGDDAGCDAGLEPPHDPEPAVASATEMLKGVFFKAEFWRLYGDRPVNAHQREMLNRLLDGFEGNLTSSKWAKICKVSQDTATREIAALVSLGLLRQEGAGRSTHYEIGGQHHEQT